MTLYDGQTWEERGERIRREEADDKASLELYQPLITGMRDNCRDVDVEFTLNGERVWASYLLVRWRQPPSDVAAEVDRNLKKPPLVSYGRPPRRRLPK